MKQFYLLFFLYSFAVAANNETVDDLQSLIKSANISDESLKADSNISKILPGSVTSGKSARPIKGYPAGMLQFVIKPLNQRNTYEFRQLPIPEDALLYIVIEGDAGGSKFILPDVDTVIEGNHIHGCEFLLGYDELSLMSQGASKKRYFFLSTKTNFATPVSVYTRRSQSIFVTNPKSYLGFEKGGRREVLPLYQSKSEQFFLEHTNGLQAIPKDKILLTEESISDQDNHSRKARKHQIRQILEYIIAKENGKKFMTFAAATGSGKTNTIIRISEISFPKKVLIVTPRENLIEQIIEESRTYYPQLRIGGSNEVRDNIATFLINNLSENDITVTSLQGFQRKDIYGNEQILNKIDILVLDEAHHLYSPNRVEMIQYIKSFEKKPIELLFFTATPISHQGHPKSKVRTVYQLSDENDPDNYHITPFPVFKAIDANVNTPFQTSNVLNLPVMKTSMVIKNGEFAEDIVGEALGNNEDLHRIVLDIYLNGTLARKGTIKGLFGKFAIAFAVNIFHAERIAKYFNNEFDKYISTVQRLLFTKMASQYRKNVHKYYGVQAAEAEQFLKQFPFVFADTVHAGNETYSLSKKEAQKRMIRNKLGGSLILFGASKLIEGYDNSKLEIVFNLRPVKKSATVQFQRAGRAFRTDEDIEDKLALLFDFIYDQRQLLLSSPDVFGRMNYGLAHDETVAVKVLQHIDGVKNYTMSQELIMEGRIYTKNKNNVSSKKAQEKTQDLKRQLDPRDGGPAAKKQKTVVPFDEIASDLKALIERLKKNLELFKDFKINKLPFDEDMDVDVELLKGASIPDSSSSSASMGQKRTISNVNEDTLREISVEARSTIDELKELLKPVPDRSSKKNSDGESENDNGVRKSAILPIQDQSTIVGRLMQTAKNLLSRSRKFFVGSQMQAWKELQKDFEEITKHLAPHMDIATVFAPEVPQTIVTTRIAALVPQAMSQAPTMALKQRLFKPKDGDHQLGIFSYDNSTQKPYKEDLDPRISEAALSVWQNSVGMKDISGLLYLRIDYDSAHRIIYSNEYQFVDGRNSQFIVANFDWHVWKYIVDLVCDNFRTQPISLSISHYTRASDKAKHERCIGHIQELLYDRGWLEREDVNILEERKLGIFEAPSLIPSQTLSRYENLIAEYDEQNGYKDSKKITLNYSDAYNIYKKAYSSKITDFLDFWKFLVEHVIRRQRQTHYNNDLEITVIRTSAYEEGFNDSVKLVIEVLDKLCLFKKVGNQSDGFNASSKSSSGGISSFELLFGSSL